MFTETEVLLNWSLALSTTGQARELHGLPWLQLQEQQENLPHLPQLCTGPLLMVCIHKRNAITLLVKKH